MNSILDQILLWVIMLTIYAVIMWGISSLLKELDANREEAQRIHKDRWALSELNRIQESYLKGSMDEETYEKLSEHLFNMLSMD